MKKLCVVLAALFAFGVTAAGQSVYTPEKGSAERSAILNALRVPVERELKQKVVFVTDDLNVTGNWAFIGGRPQLAAGGNPDYSRTRYRDAVDAGAFDNNVFALVKRTGKSWRVVTYAIGCTDVCYAGWWRRFRAPKAIFPYTE